MLTIKKSKDIKKCPVCNSVKGFYLKAEVLSRIVFAEDGEELSSFIESAERDRHAMFSCVACSTEFTAVELFPPPVYTVVLAYPAPNDNGDPETYSAYITGGGDWTIAQIIRKAQEEAQVANEGNIDWREFYPLAVYKGKVENIATIFVGGSN